MISNYFKCDLHIHSNASNKTKSNDYVGKFDLDHLLSKLEQKENDIRMFSITDHNVLNVKVYKDYFERFSDDNTRLLLVGIEFDIHVEEDLIEAISILRKQEKSKYQKYHALVIFKSSNVDLIENKLNNMYREIQKDFNEKISSNEKK